MLHEGLPIYKATYDFLLQIFQCSRGFSREYKYTLGQEIKNETIQLMLDIYRANSSQVERYIFLESARLHLETIRLLIRLTNDLKQISLSNFASLAEHLESISRQLAGWQSHTRKTEC